MSFKAKDLKYEQNEPAFLRRMRGNVSSATDDPDRRSTAAAGRGFARKSKKPGDDEDDGPTYVMEGSEAMLSKDEAEALLNPKDALEANNAPDTQGETPTKSNAFTETEGDANAPTTGAIARPAQLVADAGLQSKKRKAVKVVEEEHEDAVQIKGESDTAKTIKTKPKKKAKAVKLQFDD